MVRGGGASGDCRASGSPGGHGCAPPLGTKSLKDTPGGAQLPAPITMGREAGDVFSPGAVAHGQLTRLARDSVCQGPPVVQQGIIFNGSGALQGVRGIATTLENLPRLQPALACLSSKATGACPASYNNGWPTWSYTRPRVVTTYKYTTAGGALHTRPVLRAP